MRLISHWQRLASIHLNCLRKIEPSHFLSSFREMSKYQAPMSSPPSACFHESAGDFVDGKISFESHIRNGLNHVFAGTRHPPYDNTIDPRTVNYWLGRDPLSAAIQVCMLQQDFEPPTGDEGSNTEDVLVKMLVGIKNATLGGLRAIDNSSLILSIPLFYQLLVCTALQYGNRKLVREMISESPPGPSFELLFSPPTLPEYLKFREFYENITIDGNTDTGADLYNALIQSGWAQPREYMQEWAASSSDAKAGIKLIDTLIEHGFKIDQRALRSAVGVGDVGVVEYLLPMFKLEDPSTCHQLLKSAATRRPNGAKFLEALFKHGVKDINWMPPPPNSLPHPRDARESPSPPETPLHKAAESGDPAAVEWLITHGAERLKNFYGRDQVGSAKAWQREDNLSVFQRFEGWELKEEEKQNSSCCSML